MMLAIAALAGASEKLTPPNRQFFLLYDHYFPKKGRYVLSSIYRPSFDKTVFGPPLTRDYRPRMQQLYYSVRGDREAFRRWLHNRDRGGTGEFSEGEFSESWDYECLLLLLWFGDDRFAGLLRPEDKKTRERVGHAIDSQVDWTTHHFPKTRSLYSYRYHRKEKKRGQSANLDNSQVALLN